MAKYLFIFSLLLGQVCASETIKPISKTNKLSLKEKQKARQADHLIEVQHFFDSKSAEEKSQILDIIQDIKNTKEGLVQIITGDTAPLLIVNGLNQEENYYEWIKPISTLMRKNVTTYFYSWSKFNSIDENTIELNRVIMELLDKHQEQDLTIFGYSAGGVLSLLSYDGYEENKISKRIKLHTVGSPLFGYQIPAFSYWAAPFMGVSTIDLGRGLSHKLKHKKIGQCTHWVTSNCEMDKHACVRSKVLPQTGPIESPDNLPCNDVRPLSTENHASIIFPVLNSLY